MRIDMAKLKTMALERAKSEPHPVRIVICGTRPRFDRGAALQIRRPGACCWMAISYHGSASEALAAFERLSWAERVHHADDYRIATHELDCDLTGEFPVVAGSAR